MPRSQPNCLAQHKAIQCRSLLLLSGLVPDLVLSMRQTEVVQRAVGLGVMKDGLHHTLRQLVELSHREVIQGVIPDSIVNIVPYHDEFLRVFL